VSKKPRYGSTIKTGRKCIRTSGENRAKDWRESLIRYRKSRDLLRFK
jgi:hypothetical protein